MQYMTPEQIKNLDPSLIDFMTMSTGLIIKVEHKPTTCEFQEEQVYSNPNICQHCGKYKILLSSNTNVLRAGKKDGSQTEALEEQIELEGQLEGEQKEVLRGPDGKMLLNDTLTGGYTYEGENNNQDKVKKL